MNAQVKAIIVKRLESEIEATEYFNPESDPYWFFSTLDRLLEELNVPNSAFQHSQDTCAAMAGFVWNRGCEGRFQEAARRRIIAILWGLHNEVKKLGAK